MTVIDINEISYIEFCKIYKKTIDSNYEYFKIVKDVSNKLNIPKIKYEKRHHIHDKTIGLILL
jgi:hypothetical protein